MNIVYTGPRAKEFGIVGNATGARYRFVPGQPTVVDDADGAAILAQYPGLFVVQEPAAPEKPVPTLVRRPRGDKSVRLTDLSFVGSEDEAG